MNPHEDNAPEDESERRRWRRHAIDYPAELTVTANSDARTCAIEDFSLGGVRLRYEGDPLPSGEVTLSHPTAGSFYGRLAWQSAKSIGVQFQLPEREIGHVLQCISVVLGDQEDESVAPQK